MDAGGRTYTFSNFVFHSSSGELMQEGMRVRLSKQTADILHVLLRNAGSLVTRQQIRDLLWPHGEQVDHEKIINNGISRLRYIFKDDPQKPTFIERVPKRGYRLLIEVLPLELPGSVMDDLDESLHNPQSLQDLNLGKSPGGTNFAAPKDSAESRNDLALGPSVHRVVGKDRSRWMSFPFAGMALVLLLVIAAGSTWGALRFRRVRQTRVMSDAKEISLAVAPLDASGDGAPQLAESFRLDLTDVLAQLPHVKVRAAHSVNQLHLTDASYSTYSSKLGLDVLLFGHFSVVGRDCQLQFELVRGQDATHIATLHYSGTVDQLGSIRDQIQRDVLTKLEIAGANGVQPRGSTSDPQAYESYLQANYQFSQQTPESLAQAVNEYRAAIERDPNFAKAYVGLAQTQLIRLSDNYITPQEGFAQASGAVDKALRLDQSNPQVHSILGFIRFYRDWDFTGAIEEDRQAVHLDPDQAIYHQWLAVLLCDAGRYQEALSEIDIAQSDDPYWPSLYTTEAYIALNARDYKRMLAAARKLEELLPESTMPHDVMANALWYSGHYKAGIAEWRHMAVLQGDTERVKLEDAGLEAFVKGGVPAYARVRIQAFNGSDEPAHDPNDFDPFEWYMAAGDHKAAIATLKTKVANRDHVLFEMLMGPFSDPILHDPDFQAIMNLPGLSPLRAARFVP